MSLLLLLSSNAESTPAPANAFLPNTTGVYGAYGTSQMVSGYTGNCCKIRRSSDNVELDFALVYGEIDSDAVVAWLAGATGYIVQFYDQSGNANHLTEATSAECPVFVPGGTIGLGMQGLSGINYAFGGTYDGRNFGIGIIGEMYGTHHLTNFAYFGDASGGTPQFNWYETNGYQQRYHSVTGGGAGSVYMDSHKQCLSIRGNGSNVKFRSRLGASTVGVNAVGNFVGGVIGAGYAGTTNHPYINADGFVIYNAAPSDGTLDSIDTAITIRFGVLTHTKTWLFCGDSLTAGYGSLTSSPWSKKLIDLQDDASSIRHCSAGFSGATTAEILASITDWTTYYNGAHTQNRVYLLAGTNDMRIGVSSATTISNLTSIITAFHSAGFNVVQLTVPPGTGVDSTSRTTVNAAIMAGTTGADIKVNVGADSRLADGAYQYDGLHFNDLGYAVFAELVDAVI